MLNSIQNWACNCQTTDNYMLRLFCIGFTKEQNKPSQAYLLCTDLSDQSLHVFIRWLPAAHPALWFFELLIANCRRKARKNVADACGRRLSPHVRLVCSRCGRGAGSCKPALAASMYVTMQLIISFSIQTIHLPCIRKYIFSVHTIIVWFIMHFIIFFLCSL